ncbi:FAD-dependent monooxygenase [Leifsonia kafniensis]|uniref:FAD-dependent monooxygenase n=1 Tax=Leifsonia kafniensis TaxID=475957 RepID=A0ABP7KX28_9MICO
MNQTTKSPTVAVIGGGLAGLASAVGLLKYGFDVQVFEQARQLGEVGAGINISPQAAKALIGIGLGEQIAEVGNVVTGHLQRSMYTGDQLAETLFVEPGHSTSRYGAPYYTFHRADLIGVLAGAVDPERVHLGERLVGLDEGPEGVTLTFASGTVHTADVVIGADGIHSRVREVLYGEDEPEFTGQMVWRALIDGDAFPEGFLGKHGFYGWIGKGSHLMTYYLRGTNFINITTQADADGWLEEGWSIGGDPDEMRKSFPNATPELQSILDSITQCSKWGLFGRKPTENWGRGRVQLIGDAAHPMLPNAGQGAAQSFEDAYVLARWLDTHRADPEDGLEGFRHVRIPRAHAVQRQSLANSKLVHAGDWEKRQEVFQEREKTGDTPLGLGWIYGYEPEQEWSIRREYPLSSPAAVEV